MTVDPFAAAQVETSAPASTATATAPEASGLDGAWGDEGSSLLFSQGAASPALFNKTHFLGAERTGIITKTADQQDRDFNAKLPKYWSLSKVGGEQKNRAITTEAIDGPTGQPNRPVMVTHITLSTSYRMDAQEAAVTGRDASFIESDNGERVEVVGGLDYKPFREAIADAVKRGVQLRGAADLIGKRLTVKRAGQKQNPGGNPSWVKTYRIDNA